MIQRAFTPVKTKTLLCAAACFALPSLVGAQSLDASGNYSVQPVYINGSSAPSGGGDLVSPVYSSIEASDASQTTDAPDINFPPMPTSAQVTSSSYGQSASTAGGNALTADPNNGLVTVQLVPVAEMVTTNITRSTEIAANPPGSTQAEGFGWRLNALTTNGFSVPSGLVGDLGAMVGYHPNWSGSAEHMFLALPYADIQLGKRVYLSTERGFGLNILASKNAAMSVALDYRFPRMNLDQIQALDHASGALTTGGRLNLYVRELEVFLNADVGVYGDMSGWDMEFGLSTVQPISDRLAIKLTGAVSGADKELLENLFGVSAAEAATLDVPEFGFDRFGLKDMRLAAEAKYFFSNHLGIYGSAQVKVLLDQVAESSLVDDLGDAVQLSSNLGLIYRF